MERLRETLMKFIHDMVVLDQDQRTLHGGEHLGEHKIMIKRASKDESDHIRTETQGQAETGGVGRHESYLRNASHILRTEIIS